MKKIILNTACMLALYSTGLSQAADSTASKLPSISIGAGALTFSGDIGTGSNVSSYSSIRAGYSLAIEKRFGSLLGVSLNGMMGKLAKSERSSDPMYNRNFEAPIMQFGLGINFHFDNLLNAPVSPFLGVGFGYVMFTTYSDLKDAGGRPYYYWSDGSIRDLPQVAGNENIALYSSRDYSYETKIDSCKETSSMVLPITAGFELKVSSRWTLKLAATYHMAFTDCIDGIKQGSNDSYLYSHVAIVYSHHKKPKDPYTAVDFSAIDKLDQDGDGVIDIDDKCPGTPPGVKIDGKGCPLDEDKDGVPDYRDKEPNTKKGAIVNSDGVTQTDASLAKWQAQWDSLASEHSSDFSATGKVDKIRDFDKLYQEKLKQGEIKQKAIPDKFKMYDYDKDGHISSKDIEAAIDKFFDGEGGITAESINELIDFFFEQ